jgi:hypothetical protein
MRTSKQVPKREVVLSEVDEATRKFKFFVVTPEPVGEARFEGSRRWVTDDALVFQSSKDVSAYFEKREAEAPRTIAPGEYVVPVETVTNHPDRVVIRLRNGDTIILKSS